MFELSHNGKTITFKTAQEMQVWRERMNAPTPILKNKKTKKVKISQGLFDRIKKSS